MSAHEERSRWNRKYAESREPSHGAPVEEDAHHLRPGRLLDLACGVGRQSAWLADRGFDVVGLDISEVGLARARARTDIAWVHADAGRLPFRDASFDSVVVRYYLFRDAFPQIRRVVKPGGTVYYQTFTKGKISPRFVLRPGELRERFADWEILTYREVDEGDHAFALIVARRP